MLVKKSFFPVDDGRLDKGGRLEAVRDAVWLQNHAGVLGIEDKRGQER